jgi:hypothetical protein
MWLEGGTPNARKALELARELEERYGRHPLTTQLVMDAERRYEAARQLAGSILTAAITGRFESLLTEYRELRDQGVLYVPALSFQRTETGKLFIDERSDNFDVLVPQLSKNEG